MDEIFNTEIQPKSTDKLNFLRDYFNSFSETPIEKKFLKSRRIDYPDVKYSYSPTPPFLELTGRIQFPLTLYPDLIVGVSARALDDNPLKYITLIDFDITKSFFLYGIDKAFNAIRNRGFAIVVEGIIDVLRLNNLGFYNVVAPLGTNLTDLHLKYLNILTKNIVLMFDGDPAGDLS